MCTITAYIDSAFNYAADGVVDDVVVINMIVLLVLMSLLLFISVRMCMLIVC